MTAPLSDSVAYLTHDLADPTIVVGPMVWHPSNGTTARINYFIVAGCGKAGFHCDQIVCDPDDRWRFITALSTVRPSLVVSVMEDELDMARFCESLWP